LTLEVTNLGSKTIEPVVSADVLFSVCEVFCEQANVIKASVTTPNICFI